MHPGIARTLLVGGLAVLGACADGGDTTVDEPAESADERAVAPTSVADVDTTAVAVWAHLQEEPYTDWPLWPGTSELYEGGEPHGMLLTTYVNDVAADALANGAGRLPQGSFVVKENYTPDGTLAAVTTMYKAGGGYNPDHNDWWFAKFLPDGTPDRTADGMAMAGRLGGCQSCHGAQAANDYILTAPLRGAAGADGR